MLEASRGLELCEEEPESFELNLTAGQLAAVDLTDSLGTFEAGNAPYHLPFLQSASKHSTTTASTTTATADVSASSASSSSSCYSSSSSSSSSASVTVIPIITFLLALVQHHLERKRVEQLSLRIRPKVQCGAVVVGASSPFESSLSGAMLTEVGGESTSQMSLTETKDLVAQLVKKGAVQLRFRRGVDPSFCTGNICDDRTVIEGSDTWTRCGFGMTTCGNYCCCPTGTEYSSSFLGVRCVSCGA